MLHYFTSASLWYFLIICSISSIPIFLEHLASINLLEFNSNNISCLHSLTFGSFPYLRFFFASIVSNYWTTLSSIDAYIVIAVNYTCLLVLSQYFFSSWLQQFVHQCENCYNFFIDSTSETPVPSPFVIYRFQNHFFKHLQTYCSQWMLKFHTLAKQSEIESLFFNLVRACSATQELWGNKSWSI